MQASSNEIPERWLLMEKANLPKCGIILNVYFANLINADLESKQVMLKLSARCDDQ
jgi:hypothetical protein